MLANPIFLPENPVLLTEKCVAEKSILLLENPVLLPEKPRLLPETKKTEIKKPNISYNFPLTIIEWANLYQKQWKLCNCWANFSFWPLKKFPLGASYLMYFILFHLYYSSKLSQSVLRETMCICLPLVHAANGRLSITLIFHYYATIYRKSKAICRKQSSNSNKHVSFSLIYQRKYFLFHTHRNRGKISRFPSSDYYYYAIRLPQVQN